MQQAVPCSQLTDHLLEQGTISLSEEHAEIQNLRDVEQEVVVNNFSKDWGSDEVILQRKKKKSHKRILHILLYKCHYNAAALVKTSLRWALKALLHRRQQLCLHQFLQTFLSPHSQLPVTATAPCCWPCTSAYTAKLCPELKQST